MATPAKKGDTCPAVRRGSLAHPCAPQRKKPQPVAISFGHDRPWGGVSPREYRRMAQKPWHPLAYRVHFAAPGWADRQGRAAFTPGRLATLLGKEGKPLSDRSTTNAVSRAKRFGLVSPRSGAACLVLPPHLFQKGKVHRYRARPSRPVTTHRRCSQHTPYV